MNTEFDLQTRLEAAEMFSLVFTAGLLILNLGGVIMIDLWEALIPVVTTGIIHLTLIVWSMK
jgi:hypothetical protein